MDKKVLASAASAAALAALAVPALAGAHAVVSPVQPQGDALTSARTAYVLRVPTERPNVGTWRVRMLVPAAVQEAISFQKLPGWRVDLRRVNTGKKDADGNAVLKTTSVTWTAKTRDAEADPGFYAEFPFRFQNPATPGTSCFRVVQSYRKDRRHRLGGEVVRWFGSETSDTPASCITFKAAAG
jgi:uncharacterized protein YcnI